MRIVTAGADGLTFRSADTNFVLRLHGYVQADGRFYPDDANRTAPNDTFLLRRVRTIFEGTVFDKFDYRMMLDFGVEKLLRDAAIFPHMDGTVDVSKFKIVKSMFPQTAGRYAGPE